MKNKTDECKAYYTIAEAMAITGQSRYMIINNCRMVEVKGFKRRRIPHSEIERMFETPERGEFNNAD